jgi:Tol biopolymer transport system component
MTTFDRFDPFERRIGAAMDDIAGTRPLDYLDDVFRQSASTSQRPRGSFPERWFNVDTTFARPTPFGRRVSLRSLLILVVLAAMVSSAAIYFGSQRQLPPPIGPAANGQIVYSDGADLYVRDALTAEPRLLLGGDGYQGGPALSPNGLLIAYDNVVNDVDHVYVANIDGSNPRQVLDQPFTGGTFAWAYDSRSAVAITDSAGFNQLWVAPADGSGAREIKLDGLRPQEAAWDPSENNVLLVRAEDARNGQVDFYYVDVSPGTSGIRTKVDLPNGPLLYGPYWENVAITFSPDGSTIAYAVLSKDPHFGEHFRVHLMSRDGTNDREIAMPDVNAPSWPIYSKNVAYSQSWPTFSPDGKSIAMEAWVTTPTGSVNVIALAPADLSGPTVLIGPSFPDRALLKGWSPDGSSLLVYPRDGRDVWSIDPVAHTYEKLAFELDYVPGWQRLAP